MKSINISCSEASAEDVFTFVISFKTMTGYKLTFSVLCAKSTVFSLILNLEF